MASKWADGLPRWQPHRGDDGQVYSLAHLHPKRFILSFAERADYAARDVEIRVAYSSHSFTIGCPEGAQAHLPYSKPHEPRVFCPIRYGLALQLPALIEDLPARKCYATNHTNYFIVEQVSELLAASEYWVFFNLKKCAEAAVKLFIDSAYPGDKGRAPHNRSRQGDSFRALVNRALGLAKRAP